MTVCNGVDAQVDFSFHSGYAYLKGKDASSIPANWMNPGFDDSGWARGPAPFRYGDGTGGTELSDMQGNYSSLYLRSTFTCSASDLIKELSIMSDYDDGFILWINGVIALYRNVPGNLQYNGFAPENHESGMAEETIISVIPLNLVDGVNQIAVQAFNVNLASTDFYIDIAIYAEKYMPELIDSYRSRFFCQAGF